MNTIVIDPGHGGGDNGAVYGYEEEDDLNLSIAFLLRCELQRNNYTVYMTREKDEWVSLADRCKYANEKMADLFISIHCDAFHKKTVSGISTHFYGRTQGNRISNMRSSFTVATSIMNSLTADFPGHKNRGVKSANFYVLKHTDMAAVLIECEFISNPNTRRFLKEPENQLAVARAIIKGIKNE